MKVKESHSVNTGQRPMSPGKVFVGIFVVWLALAVLPLFGTPSSPEWFSISENGQNFMVRQRGDEFFSWYESEEGLSVALNGSGNWEIQKEKLDGSLGFEGTGDLLGPGLVLGGYDISPFFSDSQWAELKYQRWLAQKDLPNSELSSTYRLLVVLGYFSDHTVAGNLDESMVSGNVSGEDYQDLLEGSSGVINTYFNRESNENLSIDSHVTSWLPLSGTEESYLFDREALVTDAMSALSTAGNLSGVPVDGSLVYDGLLVIHSGADQARSSAGNITRVWSGAGNFSSDISIFSGNISIKDYAVVAALGGNTETATTDTGTLCHEVGHLLGLVDLQEYDTGGLGPGAWDLMGTGAWGFGGNIFGANTPTPLGAWSRLRMGWATATELTVTASNILLAPVQDGGEILRLPSESSEEYFLIENRSPQDESWALAPMGNAGLLIWHVEESGILGDNSGDWKHPLVKVEEADKNDSLGSANLIYEEGDLWSFQSILGAFSDGSGKTGVSSRYEDGFYYERSVGDNLSYFHLENFRDSTAGVLFDFSGTKTKMSIKDFVNGEVEWLSIEGATGYDLQRRIGSDGGWTNLLVDQNQLTYTDVITGSEAYQYRVRASRYDDEEHWSAILNFGLQLEEASFDPQTGHLDLVWNLPINLVGSDALELSGVRVVDSLGGLVFTLAGNQVNFSYPVLESSDILTGEVLTSGATSDTVSIELSDAQRYEWISNSSSQNSNLFLELEEQVALAQIVSGNLLNSSQSIALNNAVAVSSEQDTTPPVVTLVNYADDSGEVKIYYDEPLYLANLPQGSLFSLRGANGLTTDLDDAVISYHGNLLTLVLTGRDRIRAILIQSQNTGELIFDLPQNSVSDLSSVFHSDISWADVVETPDAIAPSIKSFKLDNRNESRFLEVTFSEPIFFLSDVTPTADEFGIVISSSNGQSFPLSGNAIGKALEMVSLDQSPSDSFGGEVVPAQTLGVTFQLSEDEVEAIDAFNDDLNRSSSRVFTNPAPTIYARLTRDGNFTDYNRYLQSDFVCDKNTLRASNDYIPRRRARFIHPHYSTSVTGLIGSQESLIWKWKHRLTYEINGGWSGDELLQVEWENGTFQENLITSEIIETGLTLSPDQDEPFQYLTWDTRLEEDALGYVLKVYRQEAGSGTQILLDTSAEVEIDNTSPQVTISYVSQSNPSYKVNATDVFSDASELYEGHYLLTEDEKNKANVLIVATFTEPMIEAPMLSLDQPGTADLDEVVMSTSSGNILNEGGGNTASVFYYAYDIQPQDAGDYSDGTARVEITSIQDRSVGDLDVDVTLSTNSTEIQGNRSLTPFDRLEFSIDTIAPTVSSLEFVILDESIIEEFSTLNLTYSEDLYRPASVFDATPLDSSGDPITGVFGEENYVITGSGAQGLRVSGIDRTSSGSGPYKLTLDGIVDLGTLSLSIFPGAVRDLHNNVLGEPDGVTAVWPGPLRNRSEVFLPLRGRTRLLMSGGFPPYSLNVSSLFSDIAGLDQRRPLDLLGLGLGSLTVEVIESRTQTRFVNVDVIEPYPAKISDAFQAFRDELDYRMVGMPFNLPTWDGTGLMKVLQKNVGTMGEDYVLYTYNEKGEYQVLQSDTETVGPGYGFWMASRKKRTITVEGEGSWPLQVVGVDLHAGWNLIGNPFDESLDVEKIYVSADGRRTAIDDLSQSQTANEIWTIDITSPQYQTIQRLEPFQGAWLYVNNPEGVELIFYRGEEEGDLEIDYEPVSLSKPRSSQSPYPPSRPGSFSTSSSVGSSEGGGGGGCLLK